MSWKMEWQYWFNVPLDNWSIYDNKGVYMFKDHRPSNFYTKPRYSFGAYYHMLSKVRVNGKHCTRHCYYSSSFFKLSLMDTYRNAYGYRFILKEEKK